MPDIFEFAGFRFSEARGLERNGYAVPLAPKARALLRTLLVARGGLVSSEEITRAVWPDTDISDNSIDHCVHKLRKALRTGDAPEVIQTVYGAGLRIAPSIRLLSSEEQEVGSAVRPHSPVAQALCRSAIELASRRSRENISQAVAFLMQATQVEPDFVPAWLAIADFIEVQVTRGHIAPSHAAAQASAAIAEVLRREPSNPGGLAALGWQKAVLQGEEAEGLAILVRARDLDPDAWLTRYRLAWVLAGQRQLDGALAELEAGLTKSPFERGLLGLKAYLLVLSGKLREADEFASHHLRLRPDVDTLHLVRSMVASLEGQNHNAVRHAEAAAGIAQRDTLVLCFLASAYAFAGDHQKADAAMMEAHAGGQCFPPGPLLAAVAMVCGDRERAEAWLVPGEVRAPWAVFAWCDPRLEPVGETKKPERPTRPASVSTGFSSYI